MSLWLQTSITWYLYLLVIGLVFFPFTSRLFSIFFDKGYAFAKTIGIITLSYLVFLLGIFHLVPFSQESIFFILLIIGVLSFTKLRKEIIEIRILSLKRKIALIAEELLFLFSIIFFIFIRGQEPSIHGLEKFMDFGFMQAIGRSTYFPPLDMWLSSNPQNPTGYAINYYYFGHLSGAMLIKLTGISPFMGYNLILATLFAQGITLALSFTSNIIYVTARYIFKKAIHPAALVLYGVLGSYLMNLAGNLHPIYLLTNGYPNDKPIPFWQIFQNWNQIQLTMTNSHVGLIDALVINSKYWYPNATRFIPFTIHEFPAYSYVVADLHGHVFDIPFVLVTLAILFILFVRMGLPHLHGKKDVIELFTQKTRKKYKTFFDFIHRFNLKVVDIVLTILLGFMIAINYMTNAFDGPIYILLAIVFIFLVNKFSLKSAALSILLVISFLLFSLPFSYFFKPFATGIGVNCSNSFLGWTSLFKDSSVVKIGPFLFEKENCQSSPFWMMFVLWGFFWITGILYVLSLIVRWKWEKKKHISLIDYFILIIFAFGTFLIIIPEFFYVKDIYPAHFRANTMFKLGYQAFMMMSIISAVAVYLIGQLQSKWKYVLKAIFVPFLIIVAIYPYFAFPSYYPSLIYAFFNYRKPVLDGSLWMRNDLPQDKEIIDYLNTNVSGQPNILEAQGDSYTDYDRVSSYTGLPTVAGWWVHQWLWRGSSDVVGSRIPDIEALYQSEDVDYTKYLLKKYNISYVVISKLEKQKYPKLIESKFGKTGTKIFESSNGSGALYKVY